MPTRTSSSATRRTRFPPRTRSAGRSARAGGRLLRRPDATSGRELRDQRADRAAGARHRDDPRQEGGGARQHRAGSPSRGHRPCHREGGRRGPRRSAARSVRRRHLPGRRRHLAQHERQRGAGQSRVRDPRRQAWRVHAGAPERSRQHGAVDERRLSDRDAARAAVDAARSAGQRPRPGRRAVGEERRVRRSAQDRAGPTCRTRCQSLSARNSAASPRTWRARPTKSSAPGKGCAS